MIDLVAEFYAAQSALTGADRLALKAAGIPDSVVLWGLVGAARINLDEDETLWEPGMSPAFITPARIDPDPNLHPDSPESLVPHLVPIYGHLVDLVAWHPEYPDRWALRTGNAGWLGACEPQLMGGRMRVRRSPLTWLKAGCEGVVALSPLWQERQRLLSIADTLVAEDFEHAQALRQLMERPNFVPNVRVGEPRNVSRTGTVET